MQLFPLMLYKTLKFPNKMWNNIEGNKATSECYIKNADLSNAVWSDSILPSNNLFEDQKNLPLKFLHKIFNKKPDNLYFFFSFLTTCFLTKKCVMFLHLNFCLKSSIKGLVTFISFLLELWHQRKTNHLSSSYSLNLVAKGIL